jgi:CyaY protein
MFHKNKMLTNRLTEIEFREKVQDVFSQIQKSFDSVDPDVAECEEALGSLCIELFDQSRCILSVQPSVRQIWLALASKGLAFHFNYLENSNSWQDDKGKGIELKSYLRSFLKEMTQLDFNF